MTRRERYMIRWVHRRTRGVDRGRSLASRLSRCPIFLEIKGTKIYIYLYCVCVYIYISYISLSSLLLRSRWTLAHAFGKKKQKKKTLASFSPCTHAFASLLAKRRRISDYLHPPIVLAFILAIPIAELGVSTKKSRERKSPETLNE